MVAAYSHRRDLAVDLLDEAGMLVSVPHGAFYIMADVTRTARNSSDFALRMVAERGVREAPGPAVGRVGIGTGRSSVGGTDEARRGVTAGAAEAVCRGIVRSGRGRVLQSPAGAREGVRAAVS